MKKQIETQGAGVLARVTTTERLALTATNGMKVYDTTLNKEYSYQNGAWVQTISSGGGGSTAWGDITGTLSNQTDLQNALNAKTSASDVSTQISTALSGYATESWVNLQGFVTSLAGYATEAWVSSQGFITNVITALGYTPENTANKTGTVAGNETSTTLFPTLNGITSWIKNTLSTWVGAHGSAVVDADTILIGKSGVLGTRTWAQIKSTLFTWVDYSAITTIVGWSSFSDKRVQYIQIGSYVFYDIYVGGTSNSATTSITIAHTISERIFSSNYGNNNGAVATNRLISTIGSNVLTFDTMNSTTSVTSLSSSSFKLVNFQFIIKV